MQLIYNHLIEAARQNQRELAVICDERKLTYRELLHKIEALTASLRNSGLRRGQKAYILLPDKIDFLVAFYAVLASGGIAIPLPQEIDDATFEQIADSAEPSIIITKSSEIIKFSASGNETILGSFNTEQSGGWHPESGLKNDNDNHTPMEVSEDIYGNSGFVEENDAAVILYDLMKPHNGKEFMLTHKNLSHFARNLNEFMDITGSICEYASVAFSDPFGLGRSICVLTAGGTLVLSNRAFDPEAAMDQVFMFNCDALSLLPAEFQQILQHDSSLSGHMQSQVRYIQIGSSLPSEQRKRITNSFRSAGICLNHGLTPASRSTTIDFRIFQKAGQSAGNDGFIIMDSFTSEIESKLRAVYPDCNLYVINVPDSIESYREIPVLCYISKYRRSITPSELSDALSGYFDKSQIPKIVYRFERFPKTPDQSVLRQKLQRQLLHGKPGQIKKSNTGANRK